MHQSTLTIAASALSRILSSRKIQHAFFGGWAIVEKGADRESKDIDCLVKADKEDVVQLLTKDIVGLHGEDVGSFLEIPQARSDYVAFFWKSSMTGNEMTLVELFTGSKMKFPATTMHSVSSFQSLPILNTMTIFRGKLSACAYRSKPNDAVDVAFLASTFASELPADLCKKIDSKVVGLALTRYPDLADALEGLGINTHKAVKKVVSAEKLAAMSLGLFSATGRMAEGDVQRGLTI